MRIQTIRRALEKDEKTLARIMFAGFLIYTLLDIIPQFTNIAFLSKDISSTQTEVGFAELKSAGARHGNFIQFASKNRSIYLSCNFPGLDGYHSCPGGGALAEPKYVSVTWFQANTGILSKSNTPLEIRDIKNGKTYLHFTPQEFEARLWDHIWLTVKIFGGALVVFGYFAFFKKTRE